MESHRNPNNSSWMDFPFNSSGIFPNASSVYLRVSGYHTIPPLPQPALRGQSPHLASG